MATKEINYHQDAGHGWIEVPYRELVDLGIQKDITHFSYKKNGIVYLEEDLDMNTYMNAHKKKYPDIKLEFNSIHVDDSIIRTFPHYKAR